MTLHDHAQRMLSGYDSTIHGAVLVWVESDVRGIAKELGIEITQNQIVEVLEKIERLHDPEHGVNWTALLCAIEDTTKEPLPI